MQLLNFHANLGDTGRSLGSTSEPSQPAPAATETGIVAERSGSRAHLGRSFRRVTLVSAPQTNMRRGGSLSRPA